MILIDGQSVIEAMTLIAWIAAAIAWSFAIGTMLAHVQWWKVGRAITRWWGSIPLVADVRRRRAQEEWKYWWATRTPEQMAEYRAAVEQTNAMWASLGGSIASAGISAQEAADAIAAFGSVYAAAVEDVGQDVAVDTL